MLFWDPLQNLLLAECCFMFFCIVNTAFSGMFDKEQNQTLLVCEHWDLICILQLFHGLCLSWLRCLWPARAGQILLLVGLCAPFQNHGSRVQFLFHLSAKGDESENTPFIELMIFCPSPFTGIHWRTLIGGRSWQVLFERISGSGRVLLWGAGEFWLRWGIISREKCCLSGSHCFSCPSQFCWVHTFLLMPGHWVTTGKNKFSLTVVSLGSLSFAAFFALQEILFISCLSLTPELHTEQSASCFLAVCVALVQIGGVPELKLKIPWHMHPFLSCSSLDHIFIRCSFLLSHLRLLFLYFISWVNLSLIKLGS